MCASETQQGLHAGGPGDEREDDRVLQGARGAGGEASWFILDATKTRFVKLRCSEASCLF